MFVTIATNLTAVYCSKERIMLSLSVKTKLKPQEAVEKGIEYFILNNGLNLEEIVGHMHAKEGATEVRVSGGKIVGKDEYDAKSVLKKIVDFVKQDFGLDEIYYLLHIHGPGESPVGHLMVTVRCDKPTEVSFQSQELDYQVKEFARSLPKA
jgi:hypothetical protein